CQRTLANPAADRFGEIMGASAFYPPLAICTAGALYFAFPVTTLTAQAVMLLFLGIGMFSVYGIGRTVADPMAGLLAAFFLGTAPFVVYSLLTFQLDLPLMAMVALALYMLIRTERFSRPGWTAALGLVWGLGLLTKPTFPVYACPPLLWTLGEAMWSGRRWRRLLWIGLAGAIAVVVAFPWYSSRLLGMPLQFMNRSFKFAEQEGHAPTLTSVALLFYPTNFPTHFGFLAALCFLAGLLALHRFREHRAVLWIAALAPFVLITLIRNKNPRYALPALAAAAVVAALGAHALPNLLRRVAGGACVVAAALQVSMTAFGVPALPPMPGQSIRYVIEYPPSRDDWQHARILGDIARDSGGGPRRAAPRPVLRYVIEYPPSRDDWQHARILDDIARDSGGRPVRVSVVPNYDFFSVSNFRYEAKRRGLPFTVLRAWNATPRGVDSAILKSGNLGPDFSIAKARRIMRSFEQPGSALARLFPVVGQYPLPDRTRAQLRVRRIHAPDGVKPEVLAARIRGLRVGLLPSLVRDAENLRIDLRYRPEALLRGEVDALTVTADA